MSGSAEPVPGAGLVSCVRCGYDLAGLGDIELCPECAAPVAVSREAASALGTPWQRGASAGSWFGSAWFGLRYGLDHLAQDLRPDRDWRLAAINAAAMVVLACVPAAAGIGRLGLHDAALWLVTSVGVAAAVLGVFGGVSAYVLARPVRRLKSSAARGLCRAGLGHATQWLALATFGVVLSALVWVMVWDVLGLGVACTSAVIGAAMSSGIVLEVRQRLERVRQQIEGEAATESEAGLSCAVCGYDLSNTGPDAICPECATSVERSIEARVSGTEWQGSRTVRAWARTLWATCRSPKAVVKRVAPGSRPRTVLVNALVLLMSPAIFLPIDIEHVVLALYAFTAFMYVPGVLLVVVLLAIPVRSSRLPPKYFRRQVVGHAMFPLIAGTWVISVVLAGLLALKAAGVPVAHSVEGLAAWTSLATFLLTIGLSTRVAWLARRRIAAGVVRPLPESWVSAAVNDSGAPAGEPPGARSA